MSALPVEPSDSPASQRDTPVDFATVRATVEEHFPALWPAVEGGLSTCATLLLADNVNPVALIYVGPPSAGKTTVVSIFDGAKANGQPLCYRSDKFTPASFVSQSAKATRKQLDRVDLLPRIQYKVLLTPELSTIFRGKQDELAERFSTITRVLDGQGLKTDSGTHGQRGYEGDYLFAWLGATTPFDTVVWKVMAQLGSRMFFLVLDAVADPTLDELVTANSQLVSYKDGVAACQAAIHRYLAQMFALHGGVRKVQRDRWSSDPPEVLRVIARCAKLLATMRTVYDSESSVQPESPHRANAVLHNLARGHALICGRTTLIENDLPMIVQVTLSSIPRHRRATFLAFVRNSGEPLTVSEVGTAAEVSRHSAEECMKEMEWLGFATFHREGTGKAAYLVIRSEWKWCMEDKLLPLFLRSDLAEIRG
jgi:hypothetical protein